MAQSMKVGGGGRFARLKALVSKEKGVTNPGAIAAAAGREKYGSSRFQAMASAGKK